MKKVKSEKDMKLTNKLSFILEVLYSKYTNKGYIINTLYTLL